MWLMLWLTLALPTPVQQPAAVAAPAAPAGSKVRIGRYQEYEDFLLAASVLPNSVARHVPSCEATWFDEHCPAYVCVVDYPGPRIRGNPGVDSSLI